VATREIDLRGHTVSDRCVKASKPLTLTGRHIRHCSTARIPIIVAEFFFVLECLCIEMALQSQGCGVNGDRKIRNATLLPLSHLEAQGQLEDRDESHANVSDLAEMARLNMDREWNHA
jgi:hypothetical protein